MQHTGRLQPVRTALGDTGIDENHSSIGYIAPTDKLNGREQEILAIRDARLHETRERRPKK